MKKVVKALIIGIVILGIVGEVKCVIKAINCNWNPIGKAECIYTGASLTGLGCIVGYLNIQDK